MNLSRGRQLANLLLAVGSDLLNLFSGRLAVASCRPKRVLVVVCALFFRSFCAAAGCTHRNGVESLQTDVFRLRWCAASTADAVTRL